MTQQGSWGRPANGRGTQQQRVLQVSSPWLFWRPSTAAAPQNQAQTCSAAPHEHASSQRQYRHSSFGASMSSSCKQGQWD